jgi:uncharacterized protein YbcI
MGYTMTHVDDKISEKRTWFETHWIEPMDPSQGTIGEKVGRAARAFEKLRTKHGRNWVAVFMNEDAVVIALHGSLTAAEKTLAQSPAGAAQVWEFHRDLFADVSATLFQKIKSITGMIVRDVIAEIEPTTGGVVQLFTTDTVGEEFLLAPGRTARIRASGHKQPRRRKGSARRGANALAR